MIKAFSRFEHKNYTIIVNESVIDIDDGHNRVSIDNDDYYEVIKLIVDAYDEYMKFARWEKETLK